MSLHSLILANVNDLSLNFPFKKINIFLSGARRLKSTMKMEAISVITSEKVGIEIDYFSLSISG